MSDAPPIQILPYSLVVGQEQLKLALELAYIAPMIGGVLISGQRGTGKSTVVRSFAQMMYGRLPVTLPINATEDRVIGGWDINKLMLGETIHQPGLLEEANGRVLYIDEVNLLDDHIVNIILDVTAMDILVIQREGKNRQIETRFTLVGTMNPEEGGLRPQLLDRFGLMVYTPTVEDASIRREILKSVLAFDHARFLQRQGQPAPLIDTARVQDEHQRNALQESRQRFYAVDLPEQIEQQCIDIALAFKAEGHRGDYLMALAARAYAAREHQSRVEPAHVAAVAPLVLQHRRQTVATGGRGEWSEDDNQKVKTVLKTGRSEL